MTELESIISLRPRIVVFLPNTNELQRFVLSGAFDELAQDHEIHYVVPSADLAKMQAAAPDAVTESNTLTLDVPADRYAVWASLFQAACFRYADRSPSFAIRSSFLMSSGRARFLKRLPIALWPFAARAAAAAETLPLVSKRWRARLTSLSKMLQQANNEQNFKYVQPDAYDDLVRRTLDSMKPMPEISDIFARLQPLYAIIPSSLLDLYCNDVLWSCETEEVACLVLQSGWDNLSSKGIIHHQPTALGCWGRQSEKHAAKIQQIMKPLAMGSPHYEFLKPAPKADVALLRRSLNIGDNDRLVLFGGSFRQFDETGTLKRLDEMIDSGRFGPLKILFRPHPWRADRQDEDDFFQHQWKHVIFDPDMQDRYVRARREPGYLKRAVPMYDMAYLARVLSAVNAVISPMSTLLLEALIMQRPTMAIAFGDGKHAHNPSVTSRMTHFSEARQSGAIVWCDDDSRFEADLQMLLQSEWQRSTRDQREILIEDTVTLGPGTYASRLAEASRVVMDRPARKLRAQRTSRRRKTISNSYGANLIARDYCHNSMVEPDVPGYWMHGWIPEYHNVHPAIVALHKKEGQHRGYDFSKQIEEEKETVPQWVSRGDQADYLLASGYRMVKPIGLPIVYLPDADVRRIPGSLLVMPPHSHRNHGPDDPLAEEYAKQIHECRRHFEHIWVCLHEDDLAKKQWIESFAKRGIGVFPSADQSDPFTLARLKRILSSFEYVTTNGFGSHIAYAAYCGAKVSVFGPFAEFPRKRMARSHAIKMFPSLVNQGYQLCTEAALRQHYPFLFANPYDGKERQIWGAREVGESFRLPPDELESLFGWSEMPKTVSSCKQTA